jgi:hypothetical protein
VYKKLFVAFVLFNLVVFAFGQNGETAFLLKDDYINEDVDSGFVYRNLRKKLDGQYRGDIQIFFTLADLAEAAGNDIPTPVGVFSLPDDAPAFKSSDVAQNKEELLTFVWNFSDMSVLNLRNIRDYSADLKFIPTDYFPHLILNIGIDDGAKTAYGTPDTLGGEYSFWIHSDQHRVMLYALLNASKIRVVLMENKRIVRIDVTQLNSVTRNSLLKEVKVLWSALPDYSDRLKSINNMQKSLQQIVQDLNVGSTPKTQKGRQFLAKREEYFNKY